MQDSNIRIMEYASQLVVPCEALLERLQIDTRGVFLSKVNKTVFNGENEYTDVWGVTFKSPKSGLYFDVIHSPLENAKTIEEVQAYRFPKLGELANNLGVADRVEKLRQNTDYATVGSFGSSIFMKVQQIRGYSKVLEDMLIDEDIANYLMDKVLDIRIQLADLLIDACGSNLDIIEMADDISGQDGPLVSPPLYRKMIKPRTQKLIEFIKSKSDAKILYHSCGDVFPMIEDFIEIGVDILNPVQVAAKEMGDLDRLKNKFGNRLSFWGAIDSQYLLPNASPQEVCDAVRHTVNVLGNAGGYVLCTSHNIQSDVPIENILAMYQTAKKSINGLRHKIVQ